MRVSFALVALLATLALAGCGSGGDGEEGTGSDSTRPFEGAWLRILPGRASSPIRGFGVDASGGTALSAHFSGTIDLGDGPFTWEGGESIPYVAKFDASGELAWKKHVTFGGTEVHVLATGPDGTVALGGLVRGQGDLLGREVDTGSGVAEFVAALSPDGDVRFVELFEGSGRLRVEAVAVAEDGRVAVGGVLRGDVTIGVDGHEGDPEGDAVVALFGPDGELRAAKLAPAEGKQEVEHLAFGPGESLSLLASGGSDFGGGPVHGLVTLGPALEHVASREIALGSSTSLAIGGDGSVAVGGSPSDGQVSVFGPDGELTFTQGLSSGHGSTLLGVAASGQGRYAISGEALNEVSVGELPILSGGRAAYVAELAADGTPLRALTCDRGSVEVRRERVRVVAKREVGSGDAVRRYLDLERPDGAIVSVEERDPGKFGVIHPDGPTSALWLYAVPGRLGHDGCSTSFGTGHCVHFG